MEIKVRGTGAYGRPLADPQIGGAGTTGNEEGGEDDTGFIGALIDASKYMLKDKGVE